MSNTTIFTGNSITSEFDDFSSFFLPKSIDKDQKIINELRLSELPLFIYGVGDVANAVHEYMQSLNIIVTAFFVDSEYHKQKCFNGLPCLNLEGVLNQFNLFNVLIGFANYREGMAYIRGFSAAQNVYCLANPFATTTKQLNRGFFEANLHKFRKAYNLFTEPFSRKLYIAYILSQINRDAEELFPFYWRSKESDPSLDAFFNNDIISLSDNESYFDGGAYKGEDIIRFLSATGGKYDQIIAVEPDIENFNTLKNVCANIPNIDLYRLGVWSSCKTLTFENGKGQQSMISERPGTKNTINIEVDTIDSIVRDRPLTLLKLNVRASEYMALKGAVKTVRKHRPRIICFLSVANDSLFSLPLLIHSIDSAYQFYLRCDYPMFFRVFLYAVNNASALND